MARALPPARRAAKWAGIALAALLALMALGYAWLNTDSGRRFLIGRIEAIEFENGMRIGIGGLEGSPFAELAIEDLTLSDPEGVFLSVPEARLDWRPIAYLWGHLDIRSLTAAEATLLRLPRFREVPPDEEPLLPDLDIDIGTFGIARLKVEPAVSGERRTLSLAGEAHVADGRAIASLAADTLGDPGGDRLLVRLDAVPERNRLAMELDLAAPGNGVIAALIGLDAPLSARLAGKGSWESWQGAFDAALDGASVADLSISARNGVFRLQGEARLQRLASGMLARLLGPETSLDLAAALDGRRATLSGEVSSNAMRLMPAGTLDLGESRFDGLELSLALPSPDVLGGGFSGSELSGTFLLDGAFAGPRIRYDVAARRLAIEDVGLEGFRAAGSARVDGGTYLVPVEASASRVGGIDSVVGGELVKVAIEGDLAVKGSRLLGDSLRIRSPRIDAAATVIADLSAGTFAGAIEGTIDDYRIESVGTFAVAGDLNYAAARGLTVEGRIRARSTRIASEALAGLLGGTALGASDLRYGADGIARFDNIRLEAPLISVEQGSGSIGPGGAIRFDLAARSERYGPVGLTLAGSFADPRATITAERPGLGIGLAGLTADVTGADGLYRLAARGETDYGPLTANVTIDPRDALALQIDSADIGGIGFTGALRRTPQGPFAGRLLARGRGLGGVARLSQRDGRQQIEFNLRANQTQLQGPLRVAAESAIVDGRLVLYDQPHLKLDAQVADARYGELHVSAARARIDYRGGEGEAKFVVEGSRAFPFRLAGNARLAENLWQATLAGRIRGIDVTTDGSARIVPGDGGYELLPTRFAVGGGAITLAGRYGERLDMRARLENFDLALVNAFRPGLGVGGLASGSVDFAQASPGSFPRAEARLAIARFTRTTSVSVSDPVEVNFAGTLRAEGGEGRAVFRRNGAVIGRMEASLGPPSPAGRDWIDRLLAAPLSGGFRYNGPAATLFSLTGQSDQRLSGMIGIAADFRGRARDPQLDGVFHAQNLIYENLIHGTRLTDLAVNGRFAGNRVEIEKLTANAGEGTVEAKGHVSLAADLGFPMKIDIGLANARLARSDTLAASATGNLTLSKAAGETALLSGTIRLPESHYRFVREAASEVPQLGGVRFKPRPGRTRISGDEVPATRTVPFENIRLDIALAAPGRLYVSGMGVESEWKADLRLTGTSALPRLSGTVSLVRGTLDFAGRSFTLREGRAQFTGTYPSDPTIAIRAEEDIDDIAVAISVTGRAYDPQIGFSSVPGLPQDEIVSRIMFGSSIANLSAVQAVQLAASLNSLRGSGGLDPLRRLRSATGFDRLRILGADEENGRGTAIAAGRYITDDVYIELVTDARGFTATQLEVSLSPTLSILSQAGGSGTNDFSIRYKKNY